MRRGRCTRTPYYMLTVFDVSRVEETLAKRKTALSLQVQIYSYTYHRFVTDYTPPPSSSDIARRSWRTASCSRPRKRPQRLRSKLRPSPLSAASA